MNLYWGPAATLEETAETMTHEVTRLLAKYGSLEIINHRTYTEVNGNPSPQEEQWRATLS